MYLIDSSKIVDGKTENSAINMLSVFGIPNEWYQDSDSIEIWGTTILEQGDDACSFKFFKDGKLTHEKTINGY